MLSLEPAEQSQASLTLTLAYDPLQPEAVNREGTGKSEISSLSQDER